MTRIQADIWDGEALKLSKRANYKYSETKGRLGPDYYDCSGLVYEALKHIGVTLSGSTTVPEYNSTHAVPWKNAVPGDLGFWGAGGTDHVGIVTSTAGNGRMWNAENPTDGIKYGPIKGFMSGFAGLRRISQLNGGKTSKNSKHKAGNSLQDTIKNQVGKGFFKFMDKLADKFGDNAAGSYGNPAGDGVSRWRKYVIRALKANGFSASPSQISAWMRVIARESHGEHNQSYRLLYLNRQTCG